MVLAMTTKQIILNLKDAGKPVSMMQLYRYFDTLNIKPLGIRQRPQQYPADAADTILRALGLTPQPKASIPTMKQLKAEKRKAKL